MDEIADQLVKEVDNAALAVHFASELARQLAAQIDIPQVEADEAITRAIIRYQKTNPRPLSFYERIFVDVAHGR